MHSVAFSHHYKIGASEKRKRTGQCAYTLFCIGAPTFGRRVCFERVTENKKPPHLNEAVFNQSSQ